MSTCQQPHRPALLPWPPPVVGPQPVQCYRPKPLGLQSGRFCLSQEDPGPEAPQPTPFWGQLLPGAAWSRVPQSQLSGAAWHRSALLLLCEHQVTAALCSLSSVLVSEEHLSSCATMSPRAGDGADAWAVCRGLGQIWVPRCPLLAGHTLPTLLSPLRGWSLAGGLSGAGDRGAGTEQGREAVAVPLLLSAPFASLPDRAPLPLCPAPPSTLQGVRPSAIRSGTECLHCSLACH